MDSIAEYDREQGKPLTLTKARFALLQALFGSLFFPVLGCIMLVRGDKIIGGLLCLFAPSQWMFLSQSIKNYRLVKQGMAVYIPLPKPLPIPKLVSVPVVVVLSVIVFVIDAMAIFIAGVRVHTLEGWAIATAVMLPLTLYAAYCWSRIIGEKQKARAAAFQEGEGVWPPAPKTATDSKE